MGYGLVLIVLLMFFHGIRELYLLHVWNRPRYPDEDENEPDPANNGTRKIHSNGFVYYSPIETETVFGSWMIWFLCFGIAFVWDFSILLFAVNGKHRISQIGAGVLFVFMASKFDFFKRIFDLFSARS